MSYFYPPDEKVEIPYVVTVKPPPADTAVATVRSKGAAGDVIHTENLLKRGKGVLKVSLKTRTVEDSPLFVEFAFTKQTHEDRSATRVVPLAKAIPAKISAPVTARVTNKIDLKVSEWVALAQDTPGAPPTEFPEKSLGRVPAKTKKDVKWFVDGAEAPATGDKIKYEVKEEQRGKTIDVEAYIGERTGRAVAKVKVAPEKTIVTITALDKWFLPGAETCHIGYTLEQGLTAGKLELEVHGSHYSTATVAPDRTVKFTEIPSAPAIFSRDLAHSAEPGTIETFAVDDWNGKTTVVKGALKARKGADRFINVAFSPYTVHVRYHTLDADKKARLELKDFWPRWKVVAGADTLDNDSLAIKWTVFECTRLKKGELRVVDKTDAVLFKKDLAAADVSKGAHTLAWDGKLDDGTTIAKANMPYRVEIHAWTEKDPTGEIGIAAMQSEVRLYVAPGTGDHPEDSTKDDDSFALGLAPVFPTVPDEAKDEDRWYQFMLARGGFHPGPVTGRHGDATRLALKEFQRSVPLVHTDAQHSVAEIEALAPAANATYVVTDAGTLTMGNLAVAPNDRVKFMGGKWHRVGGLYGRLPPNGAKSADTKKALEGLAAATRPWFGSAVDQTDLTREDALTLFADKSKEMIVWVDDRHYYCHDWNDPNGALPATDPMRMNLYRGRFTDHDNTRVSDDQRSVARPWIPVEVGIAIRSKDAAKEGLAATASSSSASARASIGPLRVDWTFTEIGEDLSPIDTTHPNYVPANVRTKKSVETMVGAEKSTLDGKDYTNCPDKDAAGTKNVGGIRPRNAAQLRDYYKAALGIESDSLYPWRADADATHKAVYSLVHDDVGQDAKDLHPDHVGKSGVFLHPSRVAGDGYQFRARLSFEKSTHFDLPNAPVLARRYGAALPHAHTARLRLWRKSSIRGYIGWAPAALQSWATTAQPTLDLYKCAHMKFVHEGDGTPAQFNHATYLTADAFTKVIKARVTDGAYSHLPITFDPLNVWPWSTAKRLGLKRSAPGVSIQQFRNSVCEPAWDNTWFRFCDALIFELLRRIEENVGRQKGHFLVEFSPSAAVDVNEYACTVCATLRCEITNNCLPADLLTGQPCVTVGCAGTYAVTANSQAPWDPRGLPYPALGLALGVTWLFTNAGARASAVWAHEMGHHRHFMHGGDVSDALTAPHDSIANPNTPAIDPVSGAPTPPKALGWDRYCIMTYDGGPQFFCGKCALKHRGWAVEHIANPASNLQG